MAAQLAGSNATLGRRGEGLLLLAGAARRRHKAAAGGPAQRDTQALLTGQDDLDLLAPQVCVCEWGGGQSCGWGGVYWGQETGACSAAAPVKMAGLVSAS